MRRLSLLVLAVFVTCSQLLAQNRTISGRITDAQGNGVPNASVTVKGTNVGTTTGPDGRFTLNLSEKARTLVVSSVGFQNQELSIGNRATIETSLVSADQTLSEVVVTVPYGTVKKTAFTGSEATIGTKTLQKQSGVTSVTRALEGQIPGLIATNGGGAPGSGASVVIRGVGSLSSSSAPLYLVNGVVYDGSISALNMDEVESVTVLKDAAATAIMGARAANGIIMITTKTGKKGKPQVTATARHGFMTRGIPEYDRVGPKEYYELMWEAIRNSYLYRTGSTDNAQTAGVKASNELINNLAYNAYNVPNNQLVDPVTGKLNPNAQLMWNDSWEDALYQTAQRKNYTFNVAGASDKSDYYISAGYLDEEGILKFSGYKRYNTRLTLNTEATSWLRAGLNLDGSFTQNANVPSGGTATTNPFYFTRQMGPIYPVYQRNAQGNYVPDPKGGNMLDWGRPNQTVTGLARPYAPNANLLGSLNLDDRSSKNFNGNANPYAEIRFLKDFSFKTTLGVNLFNSYSTTFQNSEFGDADNVKGRSTKSSGRQVSYTLNEVLTWNKRFGDHSVRVLAGHENYKYIYNQVSATRTGFPFPGTSELDNASTTEDAGSYEDNHRIESWFSGANYEFMNKYLASASVRRDGSSRFHPDSRWGTFYSAGLGWRISKEAFMQGIDWLNELKLKASYGEQGNENIGQYYAYQNLYGLGANNALRPGGQMSPVPGNPDLVWEGNQILNAGFDFSILKNRLTGTVEYFNRASDDLLFAVPQPGSLGIENIWMNVGRLVNKGVDLQLGYNAIRTKNFDWRIDLTATHFKNEITKMPPTQPDIVSGTKKLSVGHSAYDFWLKEYAGVDAATGKALYYRDVLGTDGKPNGQRVLTDSFSKASFYYTGGSSLPDFSGGITNSFRYKGFDLSFLVTFSQGGKFLDGNYQSLMHAGEYGTAWSTDILNRWQKPGDVTNVPRIQNALADNAGTSTRYLFDASYVNLKNVTLSYNLPSSLFKKVGIAGIQVFGNVDNAYLFSSRKGMDPQRSFTGTSDWSYVPYRTFTFGLTSNF